MVARVSRVGHVVLNVRDVQESIKFYTEALGMELMTHNPKIDMAFLSFGSQHHDIAVARAPEGAERGQMGLNHIAMQIEGGEEELKQLYGRLLHAGARVERKTEHSTTRSIYFFDPDDNRLEIFFDRYPSEEGRRVLREGGGANNPMELEPATTW